MNIKLPKLCKEDYVIVAVSGGPDSMALLDMIKSSSFNIVVANVNYKTRKESDLEQEEVGKFAKKYNLIYESRVASGYKKGNFESWARDFRYNFFKELYDKYNAKYLFVAHNMDDFLETYYIQKERKIITRYYGIKECTNIFGMNVCRPLLYEYKKDLEKYCDDNNVFYSIDITNLSDDYHRNRIRHNIVSKMSEKEKEQLYLKIEEENKVLEDKFKVIDILYDKYVNNGVLDVSFIEDEYNELILFKYLSMKHMSSSRMKDMINKFKNRKNIIIELDKDKSIVKEYETIRLVCNDSGDYSYVLDEIKEVDEKYFCVRFDGDGRHRILIKREDLPLTIRNYREDDFVIMKNGKKKVSRVFIDSKIGVSKRKKWPVVVNKDGIILLVSGLTKNYNYSNGKEDYDYELFVYEKEA